MKILICGANGQLGNELNRLLVSGKSEIGLIPQVYKGAEVINTDQSLLDITDKSAVDGFIEKGDFDLIINCAAMTNVDGCEEHEDVAYRVNAVGPQNLAQAAEKTRAKFVQVSTDYVFSGDVAGAYTENDPTDPRSAYGRTKLAGEQMTAESCTKHFIIRTAWLYGYVGSNFVKTMIRLAKENGTIKVVDDQYGNPTSANDVAHEILRIAETDAYGIYHCTNEGTCTWFDFAVAIVDGADIPSEKIPCTTEEFFRPAKRPACSSLRNKRLEDTIGNDMRPWQVALNEYLTKLPELEG